MAEFPIPSFLQNQSVEEIHERMLKMLPTDIDKSEGGHPWNLSMPAAYLGSYMAEFIVVEAIKLIFPKYAENYPSIMEDHAESRGMERKSATYAAGEITITGTDGTEIPKGTAFSTASVNGEPAVEFITTEAAVINANGSVIVNVQAVESGTVGNVPAGTVILKANKITGISNVTNEADIRGGTEQEDIESLQNRIIDYDAAQGVSYVGSESDYKRWAMEVDGIGNAVIIPAQDDSGLITIVLTDANGEPANETLRTEVYNHIMRPDLPKVRLAPVNGGNIRCIAPESVEISISVIVEINSTVSIGTIKEHILVALKTYLVEATQDREVRWTKIGSIISKTNGVEDYKELLLNGSTDNITISNQQLPTIDDSTLIITAGTV